MRILLTNDDGIHAEGLEVLRRIAGKLSDDVWVVAPETDQSGLAHSLTLSEPLRLRKAGDKTYALRGTPTDCVIMAVRSLMADALPDLILSGVNSGQNVADDVTYSGTVAGAMEGTLLGIRSIALSQAYNFAEKGRLLPWEVAETLGPPLIEKLVDIDLPPGTLLNVNFPNVPVAEVRGTKVTDQGQMTHGLSIEERADGRGFPYYWLKFGRRAFSTDIESDIKAVSEGYVSVTPLKLDLTNHAVQDTIAQAIAD